MSRFESFDVLGSPQCHHHQPTNASFWFKFLMLALNVQPTPQASLADLSRNASVISTSSAESLPSPRPLRKFSSPRTQSPSAPSPRAHQPPPHLTRELGLADPSQGGADPEQAIRIKSRNASLNSRLTAKDFKFGATIGEGSYSTVRRPHLFHVLIVSHTARLYRLCAPRILPLVRRTPSKCSTRATSFATIKCRQLWPRRTHSSSSVQATRASFAFPIHSTTNGASVSPTYGPRS